MKIDSTFFDLIVELISRVTKTIQGNFPSVCECCILDHRSRRFMNESFGLHIRGRLSTKCSLLSASVFDLELDSWPVSSSVFCNVGIRRWPLPSSAHLIIEHTLVYCKTIMRVFPNPAQKICIFKYYAQYDYRRNNRNNYMYNKVINTVACFHTPTVLAGSSGLLWRRSRF